jgi:iron complex transport system ATP-binding protein
MVLNANSTGPWKGGGAGVQPPVSPAAGDRRHGGPHAGSPAVEARGLSFAYNGARVLSGVRLDIGDGEFASILGPNGAGKTTLIKILTGVIRDFDGEVSVYGRRIQTYRRRELARCLSLLTQNPPVTLPFLVRDVVMMGRSPHLGRFEMEKPHDREAVEQAMGLLDISNLADRNLTELSGGEVKRVFIAQAVAQESKILFLDEPTAGLDINYQIEIFKILKTFNDRFGKTVVLITHDINHAARFAKKIILLKDGRIFKIGPPEAVIDAGTIKSVFRTDVTVSRDGGGKPYILI